MSNKKCFIKIYINVKWNGLIIFIIVFLWVSHHFSSTKPITSEEDLYHGLSSAQLKTRWKTVSKPWTLMDKSSRVILQHIFFDALQMRESLMGLERCDGMFISVWTFPLSRWERQVITWRWWVWEPLGFSPPNTRQPSDRSCAHSFRGEPLQHRRAIHEAHTLTRNTPHTRTTCGQEERFLKIIWHWRLE